MEAEKFRDEFKERLSRSKAGEGVVIFTDFGYFAADEFNFVDFSEIPGQPHVKLYLERRFIGLLDLKIVRSIGDGFKLSKQR